MKNTHATEALENQDRLAMKEFVGGDRFSAKENAEEDPFNDDDEQEDEEDKIVPLEDVNVEYFEGIHPNHLSQVRRMIHNVNFVGTRSIAGRFAGEE